MSKINEVVTETAYTDLLAARLLDNTFNANRDEKMLDDVDHDAFDTAMETMSNAITIANISDVFDPRNNKLSVPNSQGGSTYATLIAKLCALFTLADNSVFAFDLTKLGDFTGTAGSSLAYVSFIKGAKAQIKCKYVNNTLGQNMWIALSGMQALGTDTTFSVKITGLNSAAYQNNQILLAANQELLIKSITAVASGGAGGNTVYTIDAEIIAK